MIAYRSRKSLRWVLVSAWGVVALSGSLGAYALAEPGRAQAFAIAGFSTQTTEPNSTDETFNEVAPFDQAGGHPFALTSTVRFGDGDPKNIIIDLPVGLFANPQAVPSCSALVERCPSDSQVGVFVLHFAGGEQDFSVLGQIFNMTPYPGAPAELGLEVPLFGRTLLIGRVVRTAEGYTLAIVGHGLPIPNLGNVFEGNLSSLHIASLETTLWGTPGAGAHDPLRGAHCFGGLAGPGSGMSCAEGGIHFSGEPTPFLTMPDRCSGSPPTTVGWADSWEEPEQYLRAQSTLPSMAYCERAPFSPEVSVRPERVGPGAPDGIDLTIKTPQYDHTVAAAPQIRDMSVTLPQGMTIDPSVANGRRSCDASGPSGIDMPTGLNMAGAPLSPAEVGPGERLPAQGAGPEEPVLTPGSCPDASIIGSAEAVSPLLAHPLEGRVYLATPDCGGAGQAACTDRDALDGNLYRIYVQLGTARGTAQSGGVLLKLEATVQVNPATGQLTVQLKESPQLPLSELSLRLFGGDGALLTNPDVCGAAITTSVLEPWSAPFTPDASPSSFFDVKGCANPQPFQPKIVAGSVNTRAGAYSPFVLTITRKDGEQALSGIQVKAPLGLSAMLASVPLCPGGLAGAGECSEGSRIGSSSVSAGAGSQPLALPGDVYLTGPYKGAPFGLAIVTDTAAGPLNLGRLVIRAQVNIDPHSAALTITTDPLPQIVLGVPLRIQRISLTLDRPGFTVNPTSCEEQQILARISSAQATRTSATSRYALASCRTLAFRPTLTASSTGRASLVDGVGLDVKLKLPVTEPGVEANLARLNMVLPTQLSTRLTSLQHSCPVARFEVDPAQCPGASIIGVARAKTPILGEETMQGPVYIVSRGHDVFPSPVVVLQGDGIALQLSGSTTIEKSGANRVEFDNTPDIPLESIEIRLPAGPASLLAANTGLCRPGRLVTITRRVRGQLQGHVVWRTLKLRKRLAATLPLPTEIAAHNGAVVRKTAHLSVTGCTPSQLRKH